MTANPNPWTDEAVAQLFKCVEDGDSAATAGKKMGRSRCSVLGKAQRLGLQFCGSNAEVTELTRQARERAWKTRADRAPNRSASKPKVKRKPPPPGKIAAEFSFGRGSSGVKPEPYVERPDPVPSPNRQPLATLPASGCKWVVEVGPYLMCANTTMADSVYCAGHHALAYVPAPPPKARARQDRWLAKNF